ncbi:hypothetical protein AVEN_35690-1, partial [Araneus ventricosus]
MPPKHGKKKINPRVDSREYTLTFPIHRSVLADVLWTSSGCPIVDLLRMSSREEVGSSSGLSSDSIRTVGDSWKFLYLLRVGCSS